MTELTISTNLDILPAAIEFNFDELRAELVGMMKRYDGLLVEATKDSIAAAKADRADLTRLATALEEARKRVKKRCLAPYESFAAKVDDLVGLIAGPRDALDAQIKHFAEEEKQKKLAKIVTAYETENPDIAHIVPVDAVMDQRWLNATVSETAWRKALAERAERIRADLDALNGAFVGDRARYAQEAMAHYTRGLDLAATFMFVERREKEDAALAEYARQREAEREPSPCAPEPEIRQPEPAATEQPEAEAADPSDPVMEYTLRLRWPRSRLIELRVWMKQRGLGYEKL